MRIIHPYMFYKTLLDVMEFMLQGFSGKVSLLFISTVQNRRDLNKDESMPSYEDRLHQLTEVHHKQLRELQERNKKLEEEKTGAVPSICFDENTEENIGCREVIVSDVLGTGMVLRGLYIYKLSVWPHNPKSDSLCVLVHSSVQGLTQQKLT